MGDMNRMFGFGEPQHLEDNQEMTHQSYGEKLKSSCSGMCIGLILFFGSLATAGWNEYRHVANQKTITEARESFQEGQCSPILPELEGALVHVACTLSNLQVLGDTETVLQGIPESSRTGISLITNMELLSWREYSSTTTKDDKVGGGSTSVTTYTYSRQWSSSVGANVNSFFKNGESCRQQNGGNECVNWDPTKESWWNSQYSLGRATIDESRDIKAGDYVLPNGVLSGDPETLTPTCTASSGNSGTTSTNPPATTIAPNTAAPSTTRRELQQQQLACAPGDAELQGTKMVWQQQDSNGEMIDYLTRSYTIYTADTASVLAEQKDDTFIFWESSYDDDYGFYKFFDGNYTATEMIDNQEDQNVGLTWALRVLTLILCIVGLVMITAPLTEVPDIIPLCGPFIGDLIGYALWVVDCLCGCCCWSFIVALFWISFRPAVAIPLLCASVVLCGLGVYATYTQKGRRTGGQQQHQSENEGDTEAAQEEPAVEVAEEYTIGVEKE